MRVSHKFCWSTWPFCGGGSELLHCPAHPRLLLQSQVAPSHLPPRLSCGLGHTFPGTDGGCLSHSSSHPLLRSEECLGKRAALSFILECDGRAAFKPHGPHCCHRKRLMCSTQENWNMLPQKNWGHHKLLHVSTWEIQRFPVLVFHPKHDF